MELWILLCFTLSVIHCAMAGFKYELEYYLSASRLPNNPEARVEVSLRTGSGGWNSQGRTEIADKSTNPTWGKYFTVVFSPGDDKELKFLVYDVGIKSDFLGSIKARVEELVNQDGHSASDNFNTYKKSLEGGINQGKQYPTNYPGDLTINHRIYLVRTVRGAASHNYSAVPFKCIIALAVNYFLRLRLKR